LFNLKNIFGITIEQTEATIKINHIMKTSNLNASFEVNKHQIFQKLEHSKRIRWTRLINQY